MAVEALEGASSGVVLGGPVATIGIVGVVLRRTVPVRRLVAP